MNTGSDKRYVIKYVGENVAKKDFYVTHAEEDWDWNFFKVERSSLSMEDAILFNERQLSGFYSSLMEYGDEPRESYLAIEVKRRTEIVG